MSIVPSTNELGTDKTTDFALSSQDFDIAPTAYGFEVGADQLPAAIAPIPELDLNPLTTDPFSAEAKSEAPFATISSYAPSAADELTGLTSSEFSGVANSSETLYGELTDDDDLIPNRNRYKDDFTISVSQGEKITLDLVSSDFDTFLQIIDPSTGRRLNNDDGGVGTNSRIEFTSRVSGTYTARVTSFRVLAQGEYALTTTRETEAEPPANDFTTNYGYGLVDAAAAVAAAIGESPFSAVPDLGGLQWGNDMVNAPEAWAMGYTGQNVTVAVIDSGVDIYHEDLSDNIWVNTGEIEGDGIDNDGNGYIDDYYGWNFGRGQNNGNVLPGTNSSGQAHGTHVAGTIAAGNNGFGMLGVAYDANIMSIRMGDVSNRGAFKNAGDLAEAIIYAVDNGADVINMSLGWSDRDGSIEQALAYAASRNVIAVSAAGNSSASSPGTPASYATDYGISVGSVTQSGSRSSFSNKAGQNDEMHHVMAPGSDIYSTMPNDGYSYMSGTSMAAPHVAGVVALMLSANPDLTHDEVRSILISTTASDALSSVSGSSSRREAVASPFPFVQGELITKARTFREASSETTITRPQRTFDWNTIGLSLQASSAQYPAVTSAPAYAEVSSLEEDTSDTVETKDAVEVNAIERSSDAGYTDEWTFQLPESIVEPVIA